MSTRKATALEMALARIADDTLDAVEEVGRDHGYSPAFRQEVRDALGSDFLDIYDEWVEEGQSSGVPQ